jgi:hypothetical protein
MKASIRASWMVESGPAVMKNATSKASTTARASRLCARPGDKFERMKCCSSGTTAVVFTIGATLCSGWSARNEAYPLSRFSHHAARLVVSTILPPVAAGERGSHMSLLGHSETIWLRPAHRRFTRTADSPSATPPRLFRATTRHSVGVSLSMAGAALVAL